MKTLKNQQGSSHLIALLAVLIIVVVGIVGYRVTQNNPTTAQTGSATATSQANIPKQIKNKADLTQASNALEATSLDSVSPTSLDSDLSAL